MSIRGGPEGPPFCMAGELGKVRAVSLWAVSIHYIIYVDVDAGSPFRGGEEPEKREMYMAGKHFGSPKAVPEGAQGALQGKKGYGNGTKKKNARSQEKNTKHSCERHEIQSFRVFLRWIWRISSICTKVPFKKRGF